MAPNNDLFSREWCDLIFDQKYRKYGGYELRTNSSRRVFKAFLISGILFVLLVSSPLLFNRMFPADKEKEVSVRVLTDIRLEKPEEDNLLKEIPPPPAQTKNTVKFVPPVVKPDEEVTEEQPPAQKELLEEKTAIGTVDFDKGSDEVAAQSGTGENGQPGGDSDVPFEIVDQMPQFPGGEREMMRFIKNNLRYPLSAQANGVQGTVLLNFVIDREGKIVNIKVIKSVGFGCDEESVRVMGMMPLWSPGKQKGQTVLVSFTMPIRFVLN
jgi:protein TonB